MATHLFEWPESLTRKVAGPGVVFVSAALGTSFFALYLIRRNYKLLGRNTAARMVSFLLAGSAPFVACVWWRTPSDVVSVVATSVLIQGIPSWLIYQAFQGRAVKQHASMPKAGWLRQRDVLVQAGLICIVLQSSLNFLRAQV